MEQILNQSEGAKETADDPAKDRAEQKQESHGVTGKFVIPVSQCGLQSAQGTGAQRAGAGVAVEAGDAEVFQAAAVELPLQKAGSIAVGQGGPTGLDDGAAFLTLTQGQYTPCTD